MKINPEDIQVPLEKTVEIKNGSIEVSLSKMDGKKAAVYKSFMTACAMDDKALVDTSDMDKEATMAACKVQYAKMQDMLMETSESGELTPAQKKLPPALQKAILKKMDKPSDTEEHEEEETEEEEEMEESDSSGQKTKFLSKKDQKESKSLEEQIKK
jgi:hypothetical protein